MNKDEIIKLLEDGAYLAGNRLYHSSFRKGSRKLTSVSWQAVERVHGMFGTGRLVKADCTTKLKSA
jgi:hypothetical protein